MKEDTSTFLYRFAQICMLIAIWHALWLINGTIREQNNIQHEFTTEIINQIKK